MFPLQLEELQTQADLGYMERVFVLDQTDEEAAAVRPKPQMFCASIPVSDRSWVSFACADFQGADYEVARHDDDQDQLDSAHHRALVA